jgi:multidrug resistance efflux pump
VKDNQRVKKGDLLFQLNPKKFELKVKNAEAQLDQSRQDVKALEAQVKASEALVEERNTLLALAEKERDRILDAVKTDSVSKALADVSVASVNSARASLNTAIADLDEARQNLGVPGEENVKIRAAKASLEIAELNLSWTSIYAPSDGYVTNLDLDEGDYCFLAIPKLAFVDSDSFWVSGYFKETKLKHIKPGNRAVVTLMGNRDKPIEGVVDSIGRAISTPDTADTDELVPEISATFDWVRLAQRVPVRIELKKVPEGVDLIAGTTASVVIYPNTSN